MVNWLPVVAYLVGITLLGFCVVHLLLRRAGEKFHAELWIPLSWMAGLITQAILLHASMLAAGRVSPWILGAGVVALVAGTIANELKCASPFPFLGFQFTRPDGPGGFRIVHWIGVGLILFLFSTIYANAASYPFTSYDGRTIWNFKAKVLFLEGTVIDLPIFTDPHRVHYHRDYPLLVPYGSAAMMWINDSLNDRNVRMFFATFLIHLVMFMYGLVRRLGGRSFLAMLVALLYCSTPFRNDWGEVDGGALNAGATDIPLSMYAMGAAAFALMWWREGRRWQWIMAAILAAGCLMLKKEGIVIFVAIGCGNIAWVIAGRMASRGRALLESVGMGALSLLVASPWILVGRYLPNMYDEDYAAQMRWEVLSRAHERLPMILEHLWFDDIGDVGKWNLYFLAYVGVVIVAAAGWLRRRDFFLDAILLAWSGAYIFTYMVSPLSLNFHLDTSTSRLLSHLLPIILLRFAVFYIDRDPFAEPPAEGEPVAT